MPTEVENAVAIAAPSLRPLDDRVAVRRDDAQDKTDGGIFLPDNAREKVNRGTVMAIGEGRLNDDGTRATPQVRIGDRVLFSQYAGDELEIDGESWLLIRETEILGVIE